MKVAILLLGAYGVYSVAVWGCPELRAIGLIGLLLVAGLGGLKQGTKSETSEGPNQESTT